MNSRTTIYIAALVLLAALAAIVYHSGDRHSPEGAPDVKELNQTLIPFSDVSSYDVILDVSPNATHLILGAINLDYAKFLDQDKRLKPPSELAKILGDIGISRNNSVVIYGECQPCGGGPSAATYTYWVMKYLGQKKIGLLNGGIDNWTAAGLPTENKPMLRSEAVYTPKLKGGMFATYDLVKSRKLQIIDARTPEDRTVGSIPGSIMMPYDEVLEKKRLKDRLALNTLFANIDKGRTVVVYTATGVKASMVGFALELLGYNASLYTWNDWTMHEPVESQSMNASLEGYNNTSR
jgi:thiosulfate/3-mercaptopyruvate sulfurtransferase